MKRQWVQSIAAATALGSASLILASCAGNPEKAKLKYLQKGDAYAKQQQYASAAIEYRNALKIDPKYTDAYVQLAKADEGRAIQDAAQSLDVAHQDAQDAYNALSQAITIDPNRTDARMFRATLLLNTRNERNFPGAISDLNSVIQNEPNNVDAHLVLGQILTLQKKYDQAMQEFTKASSLAPKDSRPYLGIANADLAEKKTAAAELSLLKAIQLNSHDVDAYDVLFQRYLNDKNVPQAEAILQSGIDANPSATLLYLSLASILESQGKPADADNVLNTLSAKQPTSAEAAAGIGDVYLQAKMNDRAQAEYQHALSLAPTDLNVEEHVEQADLESGQIDAASKIDDQLLKQSPNDLTARIRHGQVLIAQAKFADAVQWLQKVSSDAPDSPDAHYVLALAYLQNHQLVEANSELQQTLRLSPSSSNALIQLVRLNMSEQKYSVAQLYAQELINADPNNLQAHIMLGQALLGLGQTPQAEAEFATAQRLAPQNSTVLGQYVNFLIQQKQTPKADSLVSQFISQNPDVADGYVFMSRLQVIDKNYSAALPTAQKALQVDPKDVDAYEQIAQIYLLEKDNDAAIHAYEQAIALAPQSALLRLAIASIYINEGNLAKATGLLQQALKLNPNLWPAANNLAWIYAEQNQNLDDAMGLAEKAQAERPGQLEISDTLAWIMYRKGNYTAAIPLLQDCIKKAPDSAQFHYHLGMALVANGEKVQGKTELQAALHLKLDNQDAEDAKKVLQQ